MVLIKLLIAHILGDFVIQTDRWVQHKKENKIKSIYLYLHALSIGILSYLFLAKWTEFFVPVIVLISHLIIDIWKLYQQPKRIYFILDQIFHILILVLIWIVFFKIEFNGLISFLAGLEGDRVWIILFGYIFILWPIGYIVGGLTKKWQKEIENDGLEGAGMWIGFLERFLIITFILLGQYQALGFLIAAKSILRISVNKKEERKLTEYVLIGTMLSFSFAILTGIFVQHLLNFL